MPEIQNELDGRYAQEKVEALAISTGDPDWYLRAFKGELKVTMPWLLMDIRLPNPYYEEQFDLWELIEEKPTLVVLDAHGVIRYRATGDGGVDPGYINYRYAFDLVGTLIQEAKAAQPAEVPTGYLVGERALDFTLSTLEGEPYTLSDFLGKTVLLTFWGTGCEDCGALVPGVYAQEIRKHYENREDFVVLGIDYKTPGDFLAMFIQQMEIEYPVLMDPNGKIFSAYEISDEFIFIVVDSRGIIRYRERELEGDIYKALDELLGVPAS